MLVMKAIRARKLNAGSIRLSLLNAMRKQGRLMLKDFQSTVATWDRKPNFQMLISLTGPGPVMLVDTDDQIYHWVSEGTGLWGPSHSKYPIPKAGRAILAFPGTYVAKTMPGVIGSRAGGARQNKIVVRHGPVMHPGIESRKFDKVLQKKWDPLFKRAMEAALKEAVRKSGHGVGV